MSECVNKNLPRKPIKLATKKEIIFVLFADVHKFCEDLLGRPIWTHEFASRTVQEEIKEKCRPLIIEMIENEIDHPTEKGGEQE